MEIRQINVITGEETTRPPTQAEVDSYETELAGSR